MLLRLARQRAEDWAVHSQLQSRRNAMVAATALAQRTAEAREVEEFLVRLPAPREPQPRERHA